jgi:hypothetical protein
MKKKNRHWVSSSSTQEKMMMKKILLRVFMFLSLLSLTSSYPPHLLLVLASQNPSKSCVALLTIERGSLTVFMETSFGIQRMDVWLAEDQVSYFYQEEEESHGAGDDGVRRRGVGALLGGSAVWSYEGGTIQIEPLHLSTLDN